MAIGFYSDVGTKTSPYVIKTEKRLAYFGSQLAEGENFEGEYIILAADRAQSAVMTVRYHE